MWDPAASLQTAIELSLSESWHGINTGMTKNNQGQAMRYLFRSSVKVMERQLYC